jgi:uncharacterized protein YcnI
MPIKNLALASTALAAGALLALAAPLSASAHVSVGPSSAPAGSATVVTFAIGHGCAGSATTSVAISIPENVASVEPTANPNWAVAVVPRGAGAGPEEENEGAESSGVTAVVYTAKEPLPDGIRDTFALNVRLPEDAAGTTLAFPILQTCVEGENAWNQTAVDDGSEPEHPAPTLTVTEATTGAHDHNGAGDVSAAAAAAAGQDAAGAASSGGDSLARLLGVGGLAVGVVGVVLGVAARRATSATGS